MSANGLYAYISANVKAPRLTEGFKRDYLTADQARRLLQQIDCSSLQGKHDYAMLLLMLTTGLRTIEVMRALIGDLRPCAGMTVLYIQGKGQHEKAEYVKISPQVEQPLRLYISARQDSSDSAPLFASVSRRNDSQPLTTRSISRIVKQRLAGADLVSDRLTAHSLRHTAATLNLLAGGTPEETQQLLRHKSITTTMIYSHALERADNPSECRITNVLLGSAAEYGFQQD